MGEFPASGPFRRTLTCLRGWEARELVFQAESKQNEERKKNTKTFRKDVYYRTWLQQSKSKGFYELGGLLNKSYHLVFSIPFSIFYLLWNVMV